MKEKIGIVLAIMVGIIAIFACAPMEDASDSLLNQLEERRALVEKQENEEAEQIAEDYMDSITKKLQCQLKSSELDDVKVDCDKISREEFFNLCDKEEENSDYDFYYLISFSSDSIEDVYHQARESEYSKLNLFDSLIEMGKQKEQVLGENYVYEMEINKKTIRVWYTTDSAIDEVPIISAEGNRYLCEYQYWLQSRNLYINGVFYDSVMTEREKKEPKKSYHIGGPGGYSSSSNRSKYHSDPYGVNDYDDPDNFADEWAEEFGDGNYDDGYEDAYDYWESERD